MDSGFHFERSEQITLMVEQLLEQLKPLGRGDTIGHNTIAKLLNVGPHEGHWQTVIAKVKRRLEDERGITLWSEREVGYRLLTIQEQLTFAAKARLRRARRQIRKGLRHVSAVSDVGLSPHQRRLKAAQIELLKNVREEADSQYRRQCSLAQPAKVHPRPRHLPPTPPQPNG